MQVGTGRIDHEPVEHCWLKPSNLGKPVDRKLSYAHIPEDQHQRVFEDKCVKDALHPELVA